MAKHVANEFLRCAGRRDGASRRRRLLLGEGAQNKGCWRVQKVRVGELLQQPWSRSAMAQEWRAVVRGVHSARVCGACALAHSTHPFAGCMAGREDVARGLEEDAPAVAAQVGQPVELRRTRPRPRNHSRVARTIMMSFYPRFAVKHVKKAKKFLAGLCHAPHPRRVTILRCAFHPPVAPRRDLRVRADGESASESYALRKKCDVGTY